jgi:hypothetical protein
MKINKLDLAGIEWVEWIAKTLTIATVVVVIVAIIILLIGFVNEHDGEIRIVCSDNYPVGVFVLNGNNIRPLTDVEFARYCPGLPEE